MFYKNSSRLGSEKKMGSAFITSDLLLVFTCFLCGTILGCALYNAQNIVRSVCIDIVQNICSVSAVNMILQTGIIFVFVITCYLFSSFSCFGAVPLCLLAAFVGARYAVLASALLSVYTWKGLLIFVVLLLPGGMIFILSELLLFSYGCNVSKKIAACVFNADDVHIHIKEYINNTVIPVLLMLAATVTDHVMRILFGGVLYSGI